MVKQTALFFLFTPIVWVVIAAIKNRQWQNLAQLLSGLLLSVAIFFPWVRINWLLIFTAGKRATVDSAIAEGDPSLLTIDAWIYYWKLLPYHISWPLLLIPLVSILLYLIKQQLNNPKNSPKTHPLHPLKNPLPTSLKWLTIYLVGSYLICSLNINKDFRYTLPLLPIISIILAYGLTILPRPWGKQVRLITVSFAVILMLLNLWPVGGYYGQKIVSWLSPGGDRYAYLGQEWPHKEVIAEIIKSEPYLQTTLGVLPSTPEINQHNLNYYGALQNKQVYGRQVGTNLEQVPQDARSLSWFLTKTNNQGSVKRIKKAQAAIVNTIENSPEFQLAKTWHLPDNSNLNLYRRRLPLVEVYRVHCNFEANQNINAFWEWGIGNGELQRKSFCKDSMLPVYPISEPQQKVKLDYAILPEKAPPGKPFPITYKWSGPWEQLQSGLVLLTYRQKTGETQFINDHALAMGSLHPGFLKTDKSEVNFEIIERTGMVVPKNIPTGNYLLEATYLNRKNRGKLSD